MLNSIIRFSIHNKFIIGLFVVALILWGSYSFTQLPIDAVPDITNNQVQVITSVPSLGAADIERLITFPIELVNSNIPGLIELRSFSRFGLSLVTIVFDDDTDVYWARQQVAERLQIVKDQIPKGLGVPVLAPVTTGLGEIYQYVVKAKKGYESQFDITELRTIQDWIIRRQLLGVQGVADVSSFGGKVKQYEIAIDPNKLKSYGLTVNNVFSALENNNQNTGGAYIEKQSTVLYIRSEGLIGSLSDIAGIAVKHTENGTPLFIKDVAEVRFGSAIRYGAMTYNGEGEVAGAIVMMLKGANSNKVIKDVKERIDQIKKILPEGVEIEAFLDRTKMVNSAIHTVTTNLMEGALIVVFVLVLFLGNFRAGLLVASVIPLSMLFAVIMMNLFGVSGNLMSLGALDFGLIVDGAVIIVEAVMHQLAHSRRFITINSLSQSEMDNEVKHSAGKMMNSAVFGQIIILIVYLPILSLQGIEGKMFKPMAQTVAFALLGAFILSLTYIPMMSSVFLSKKIKHTKNISDTMMEKIERAYQSALEKILGIPKTVVLFVLGLFAAALITLSFLGGEFIPALEEGDFAVDTRVLTGSNLNVSVEATLKGEKILLENFPEVIKVVGKTGSGEVPTDPMPIEASDMMIILKDKSEWTSATSFDELAEKMAKALEVLPGVTYGFQYPVQMRFNELMTGARQDVVCKIFGENLDTLSFYANKLGNIINTVEGSTDLYVEAVGGMPQIVINYNRAAIAQYAMTISDINRIVNTAFAGQSTGLVFENERRFDLVVRMASEQRKSIKDVQNLLIPSPHGEQIPLNLLADVQIIEGPNQIQREDAKRRIITAFNVRGRDVQTIVRELQKKVEAQIKFPAGYYATYGGSFENLNAAKQRLSIAVPVSLLLIFLMLYFAFNSVKHGLLIYSAIPLSAIGGIFALAVRGLPFSISAGVGFIALFGVAVLNGIVLVAEFNRLKAEGNHDLRDIVIRGTKIRLRPVLMTALVASLGFLPMALSNGSGAEVQRPLATVVIGGLLIATLLTLFVLPVLYILFESGIGNIVKSKTLKGISMVLLVLFLSAQCVEAQTPISLKQAIDMALANNLLVKNERLKAEYQKQLIKTAINPTLTNFVGEYGQINSSFSDNRFAINQTLSFPTVYKNQKSVLKEEWRSEVLNVAVKELELKRQVSQVFNALIYLQEKRKLLQQNDSLYSEFLLKANLRLAAGESNVLEKTTAQAQLGQITIQLNQLNVDLDLLRLQFQLLLNTDVIYVPEDDFMMSRLEIMDTTTADSHPSIKLLRQHQLVALKKTQLETAMLHPDLMFTYNNMSMRGTGSDNVTYDGSSRFQSAQVGIGLPIFYGSRKAKINAARSHEKIREANYRSGIQHFDVEYKKAHSQFENLLKSIQYYEQTGLKNATLIVNTANVQFANGGINYLEWVMLTNQAISIRTEYLNVQNNLNESIIQLNYFNSK
ncbi:MAG: CusA/CzcA family heavy metal efflux RND transporter [Bacteroidia bacterium]|nr:CusA/CzcA family heavy metal efflux RND transporter [Bacteroidia bacterium]